MTLIELKAKAYDLSMQSQLLQKEYQERLDPLQKELIATTQEIVRLHNQSTLSKEADSEKGFNNMGMSQSESLRQLEEKEV